MNGVVRTSACFGLLVIILGAFGAHFFREILVAQGTTTLWQTAVFYHAIHTIGLLWLGGCPGRTSWAGRRIFLFWVAGIIIFSGSLYLLALTGQQWLGALTPIGGIGFLLGWICLLFAKL